ncbi:polysaccharide biosynthesis protein [Niastella yeongjuensis]|uniref:Polysaccharide biosynthesis protein n=1 Tax=Niastella yeongjuensis TaxID=354355 RepID=A0A1V9ELW1_9BACT|nr:oligosaccharide flippase family protein [Niastella yeongjuensis]OQP47106.1 polysaccharide biosynthesis protein [Niastella yeongjuensis]SEN70126.1 Membrane protein involved in the export of O-antigen and teichoic acid [Niastella yeongjuensis]
MSGIKKLAGQTLWYGVSSIFARFLNYLLTPYLTYKLSGSGFGEMSLVYAAIPFLNTLFLFGVETAYFRYIQKDDYKNDIYSTLSISLITSTFTLCAMLMIFNVSFAHLISIQDHPEYVTISALIIAFDALSALPFAKLRHEGRPVKFAFVRVSGIIINIAIIYFFLSVCPRILEKNENSPLLLLYHKDFGVGYILLANAVQSFYQLIILRKELFDFDWKFNFPMWKEVMVYALPLAIAGFAGMINETFDRIMLGWWAPVQSIQAARFEVGTYSACYKLSILITLFIQAFRMGAEPFFFKQSLSEDAPKTYARVMKFFVITITLMFLVVALYLDIWKNFIQNEAMWKGLTVVPILLFANMFLGIYYNLSIWYKLSQKTSAGAWITLIGAIITLVINAAFIPRFSYLACAWATFFCYGSMMVVSYVWGQKRYPIPYATKKLCSYMVIVYVLYLIHHTVTGLWPREWLSLSLATILTLGYLVFILRIERKEFSKLPYVGKLIYRFI